MDSSEQVDQTKTGVRMSGSGITYVFFVFACGMAAIAHSVYDLQIHPVSYQWLILAGLTLVSGSATIRVPSIPATVSVSETFAFTAVLLFGTAAGTLTVALDSLVISFWLARRRPEPIRFLFNVSAPALSMWFGANAFFSIAGIAPPIDEGSQLGDIALALLVFTIVYFLVNSWLTSLAISFERGDSPFTIWHKHFRWLSLNYFGGASLAALIVVYTRDVDLIFVGIMIPLLLVLYFTFRTSMARVEDANRHLAAVNALHLSTIETLAMAIDAKDQVTHGHVRRVQFYATELALAMGIRDKKEIRAIEEASLLHDMGKLAVPEHILNKPGPLTPAEFKRMKRHASVGAEILSAIDFPYPVVPIVRHHHEYWDGKGYPDGVSGTAIPIGARILSVVDCYDALTSDRPYRPRMPDEQAMQIITDRSGSMYDPEVVATFARIRAKIALADHETVAPGLDKSVLEEITAAALPGSDMSVARSTPADIAETTDDMLTLYELAQSLGGRLSLSDAGDIIGKHLCRMLPISFAVFYLYDDETDTLVARHVAGEGQKQLSGLRIKLGERLSGWVGANRRTSVNSDPMLDLGEATESLDPTPRSCLSTPLMNHRSLVGVLSLYSPTKDAFTDDHKRIAEAVASQVTQTVLKARQFEQDLASNLKDPMTGLPNAEHLRRLFDFSAADDALVDDPLSLLVIRMDDLRAINEQHGRSKCDQAIESIVDAIRTTLRGADMLFRQDGNELVALLTKTDSLTSRAIARRVNDALSVVANDTLQGDLRTCVGVATAPEDGCKLVDLMRTARKRLSSRGQAESQVDLFIH